MGKIGPRLSRSSVFVTQLISFFQVYLIYLKNFGRKQLKKKLEWNNCGFALGNEV